MAWNRPGSACPTETVAFEQVNILPGLPNGFAICDERLQDHPFASGWSLMLLLHQEQAPGTLTWEMAWNVATPPVNLSL